MILFEGTVFRLIIRGGDPRAPAAAPEGRFHHGGQQAIYTSLTAEGTVVAMRRYLAPGDPPRDILPLTLAPLRVEDNTGRPDASVVWQDIRTSGAPAPTWALSDAARAKGADGMLYSSRSRPDLTHLVFWADPGRLILQVGPPQPLAGHDPFQTAAQ